MPERTTVAPKMPGPTPLNRQQILGFWAAWAGWTLDGMGSFIYALVLSPALTELLPKSAIANTPGNVALAGSILFALFLVGWGMFSLWLPEQYGTSVRATAFAFAISFGRFIGAGVNFLLGALVHNLGTLGKPVAFTALAFGIGLLLIPLAEETRGQVLPEE